MGRTIIQPIGPLYGEAVNGTVFGRPNGSVFVPSTNTVTIAKYTAYIANNEVGGQKRVRFYDSDTSSFVNFDAIAQSQDSSSYIRVVMASDDELVTILTTLNLTAGQFNIPSIANIARNYELVSEETYYVALQLINNGTVIATSDIIEVVAI